MLLIWAEYQMFSSNVRKLRSITANHPQNLHFPAKTQMQMCWQSKFLWLGLEPPYMTHLVLARRANLLLAGSSFQISTEFHRRPSRKDSLEMALLPFFHGFCPTSPTLPWEKWMALFQQTFYCYSWLSGLSQGSLLYQPWGQSIPCHQSSHQWAQTDHRGEMCVVFPAALWCSAVLCAMLAHFPACWTTGWGVNLSLDCEQ